MNDSCTTIQTSLENFTEQGLQQVAVHWQKELAHASDSVGEFALTHRDKLELAKKTVDNYVTKELQHDIPTGKQNLRYSVYRCKIDCSFCMQEWPLNAVSSTILGLVTSLAHDHTLSYWRSLGVHKKLQWPYLNCQSLIQS